VRSPRRWSSRKAEIIGLAASPLVFFGLVRLLGALPASGGLEASTVPLAVERSASARWSAQLPGEPSPALPVASPCRVVGQPFSLLPESEDEAWALIQNTGAEPATLEALELGWVGTVSLWQIVSRESPAGPETVLFEGDEPSPALVRLTGAPTLAPGATLALGWRVAHDVPGVPWQPKVAVLHLAEGCRVPLRETPAEPDGCALTLGTPTPSSVRSDAVELQVVNLSTEADAVIGFEVDWPAERNGALKALTVDGFLFHEFDPPLASAPVSVDLRRFKRTGLPLPAGARLEFGMLFEDSVASGPYTVALTTEDGCTRTATTWTAVPDCGANLTDLAIEGSVLRVRLQNPRGVDRTLRTLDVFWPFGTAGPLLEVLADGSSVWNGEVGRAPANITLAAGVRVPAHDGITLHLRFRDALGGGLSGDSTIPGDGAAGAVTLVAGLDGGCRATLTTLEQPGGCNVSAGAPEAAGEILGLDLSNAGAEARLSRLALVWNGDNGALTGIGVDGRWLLGETFEHDPRGVTIALPEGVRPKLSHVAPVRLELRFERSAAPDGYSLGLDFVDPLGAECDSVLVSVPAAAPTECPYAITHLEQRSTDIVADLVHGGTKVVGLAWLEVEWPDPDPERPLVDAALVREDGSVERTLWSGRAPSSPARVSVIPGIRLVPGRDTLLRLRFAGVIGDGRDPAEWFKLTVGLDDGCRARFKPVDSPPPERVTFSGVIREPLPNPLLSCCWRIQRRSSDGPLETVLVAVDDRTRFEPNVIEPRPGDSVTVEALAHADGSIYAEVIRFLRATKPVQLVGTVQAISSDKRPGTGLPKHITVLDRRIELSDATVVEGALELKSYVSVKGEATADGTVIAGLIKVAASRAGEWVVIEGIVQGGYEKVDTPSPGCSPQVWRVDHYAIEVPPEALPEELAGGACRVPRRGDRVVVEGQLQTDSAEPGLGLLEPVAAVRTELVGRPSLLKVEGEIVALPTAGLLGSWTLSTSTGDITFDVRSLAVIDASLAPAELGMWAEARLFEDPAGDVALRVRTDWNDG